MLISLQLGRLETCGKLVNGQMCVQLKVGSRKNLNIRCVTRQYKQHELAHLGREYTAHVLSIRWFEDLKQ